MCTFLPTQYIKRIILTERNMYAFHHCHVYVDDLDGSASCFVQTLYRAWPKGADRGQWAFKLP